MNLLVEVRFRGLSYHQTMKAYDCAALVFKEELTSLKIDYQKLEVFFSVFRLTLWLRMGEDSSNQQNKLSQAVNTLLKRFKTSLPDAWEDITGIIALLGSENLAVDFKLRTASETLAGSKVIHIQDTQHYWREMGRNKVLVDNDQREKKIRQLLASAAAEAGGEVVSSPVMNEVVVASEQPVLKLLDLEDKLMDLPEQLITIILDKYRCFGIKSHQGKLLNQAVFIYNRDGDVPDLNTILKEVKTDFLSDLSVSVDDRRQMLSGMCYLSGLGSYLDKQKRLQRIVLTIADQVDVGENVCNVARKASELAKVDLTTKTCTLYPEFRGHMGAIIAEHAGVSEMVASAIVEHWCPGKYSNKLPHTLVGALLGVADRLDDICGQYYQSEFKLSQYRSVKAWFDEIITILDSVALDVSMIRLLKFSLSLYESQGLVPWREKDLANLIKVFSDRLFYYLLERDYSQGIANALTVIEPDNVYTTLQKASKMSEPRHGEYLESCAEVCKILDRTCAREYSYEEAAREFLELPEEKDLFEVYLVSREDIRNSIESRDFDEVLTRLAKLKTPILRFINCVDLDTEDRPVQFNRLSLLSEIRVLYHSFADFSML